MKTAFSLPLGVTLPSAESTASAIVNDRGYDAHFTFPVATVFAVRSPDPPGDAALHDLRQAADRGVTAVTLHYEPWFERGLEPLWANPEYRALFGPRRR